MPNLIEIQRNSYEWFLNDGLKEVFKDIFPIEDVALNPNVASDAPSIHVDVREVYSY